MLGHCHLSQSQAPNLSDGIYHVIILGIAGLVLPCAITQKIFNRYLTKNNVCFSFGKQKESVPLEIKLPSDTVVPKEKITYVPPVIKNDYTDE